MDPLFILSQTLLLYTTLWMCLFLLVKNLLCLVQKCFKQTGEQFKIWFFIFNICYVLENTVLSAIYWGCLYNYFYRNFCLETRRNYILTFPPIYLLRLFYPIHTLVLIQYFSFDWLVLEVYTVNTLKNNMDKICLGEKISLTCLLPGATYMRQLLQSHRLQKELKLNTCPRHSSCGISQGLQDASTNSFSRDEIPLIMPSTRITCITICSPPICTKF